MPRVANMAFKSAEADVAESDIDTRKIKLSFQVQAIFEIVK